MLSKKNIFTKFKFEAVVSERILLREIEGFEVYEIATKKIFQRIVIKRFPHYHFCLEEEYMSKKEHIFLCLCICVYILGFLHQAF